MQSLNIYICCYAHSNHPFSFQVMVNFDDPLAGEHMRSKYPTDPRWPRATPIIRTSFEYSLGDPEKNHDAKTKLMQFPIQLAWAITTHKCQGMTIKSPTKLVADLDSCYKNCPGMAYVMLGRIQNLSQLILRWSYDPVPKTDTKSEEARLEGNTKAAKKIQANIKAMVEAERLKNNALNIEDNLNDEWLTGRGLKMTSLNIQGSLMSRLPDLKGDKAIYVNSDIICLQETGETRAPLLEGYTCHHVGGGHNRGVAIFLKDEMAKKLIKAPLKVNKEFYQCMKLSFDKFDLITVYRANNQPKVSFQEFVQLMEKGIDAKRPTILCGDFNFDRMVENEFTRMVRSKKLRQIVQEPTTYRGYCIDHVYHNGGKGFTYKLHYPYYSDHEAVCVRLPISTKSNS